MKNFNIQIMHFYLYGASTLLFVLYATAEIIIGLTNVSSCPSEVNLWHQKESLKSCDEGNGFLYHCMKSSWENFVEFCMVPVSIDFYDGCPQLLISDDFRILYVKCSLSGKCPTDDVPTYPSYQLYKYDGCYAEDAKEILISKDRFSSTKHSYRYSTTIDPYTSVDHTTSNDRKTEEACVTQVRSSRNLSRSLIFSQRKYVLGVTAGIFMMLLWGSLAFSTYYIQNARKYRKNKIVKCHTNSDVNGGEQRVYNEIEDIQPEVSDSRSYEDPISATIVHSETVLNVSVPEIHEI